MTGLQYNKIQIKPNRLLQLAIALGLFIASSSSLLAQIHTLTITEQAGGIVRVGTTIACGTEDRYGSNLPQTTTEHNTCSRAYTANSSVTLRALPNHAHSFIGWLGDCTGNDSRLTIRMDRARTCQAVFAELDGYTQISTNLGLETDGYACAVTAQGAIDCWGAGDSGRLGNGGTGGSPIPVAVTNITSAIAVSSGYRHTCALLANGNIQCWGANSGSQLGSTSGGAMSLTPVTVTGITNAIAIDVGADHTCALLAGGTIQCWGTRGNGRLGNGGDSSSSTPVAVTGITDAIAISAGQAHSCAVLSSGQAQCWGAGDSGRLGNGGTDDSLTPVTVSSITNAVTISAGYNHTCSVLSSGQAQCWGSGTRGRLGNGGSSNSSVPVTVSNITDAIAISAGQAHSCAVLSDGQAQCWGVNNAAQGGGTGAILHSTSNPRLGSGSNGGSLIPVNLANVNTVASISAGRHASCAVLQDSLAYCWGFDNDGQIGNGAATNAAGYNTPQLVSNQALTPASVQRTIFAKTPFVIQPKVSQPVTSWSISPALPSNLNFSTATGTLYGIPTQNQAGTTSYTLTAQSDTGNITITLMLVTTVATLTITEAVGGVVRVGNTLDTVIACGTEDRFGSNLPQTTTAHTDCSHTYPAGDVTLRAIPNHAHTFVGWLGDCEGEDSRLRLTLDGPKSCQAVFTRPAGYIQISASETQEGLLESTNGSHVCALRSGGAIHCWGYNSTGELGNGGTNHSSAPTPVSNISTAISVAAGQFHNCAALSDGTARCWGNNAAGSLGNGSVGGHVVAPVTVSNLSTVIDVAAGTNHSCAVLSDGAARCWGDNDRGQLGDGSLQRRLAPATVLNISTAIDIAAGNEYTCAVLSDGAGRCWGSASRSRLGSGTSDASVTPLAVLNLSNAVSISSKFDHACAVTSDGMARCWGSNSSGQLGVLGSHRDRATTVTGVNNIVSIEAGQGHTCAALSDGTARCWGDNRFGKLGSGTPTHQNLSAVNTAAQVTAGFAVSCALLRNGLAYCWGRNRFGLLGIGKAASDTTYSTPQLVSGQTLTTTPLDTVRVPDNLFAFQPRLRAFYSPWSLSGTVPTGMRFSTPTGVLYGISAQTGATPALTLTAQNPSASTSITVTLTPSLFDITGYNSAGHMVDVDATTGTIITTVQLTEQSSSRIVPSYWQTRNNTSPFAISSTGVITVARTIDPAGPGAYTLTVTAIALEDANIRDSTSIAIRLDREVPESLTIVDTDRGFSFINENAAVGTTVTGIALVAEDQAGRAISAVTWSLTSDAVPFTINPNTGVITVSESLDFEAVRFYGLTVRVRANDNTSITDTHNLGIDIFNVIEIIDITDINPAANTIAENSPVGTPIPGIALSATGDASGTANSTITAVWSITTTQTPFAINSGTGQITLAESLDFETTSRYTIVVHAAPTGVPSVTNTLSLDIGITNAIDSITISDVSLTTNTIAESATTGTIVGGVNFEARDEHNDLITIPNSDVTWSETSGSTQFSVDPNTGAIRLARIAGLMEGNTVNLTIQAQARTANGNMPSNSLSVTITVTERVDALMLRIKLFLEGPLQ